MPFDIFDKYAKAEGFCCPLAMLIARQNWSTDDLADDAGITDRDVRYWRKKLRTGRLACRYVKDCQLALFHQTTPEHPDTEPDSASAASSPVPPRELSSGEFDKNA